MTTISIPQNQVWPERSSIMAELFRHFFGGKSTKALEVGVWYGIGSTNIWLDNLVSGSELFLIDSWRPYSSEDDLNDSEWNYRSMDQLSTDAFLSTFLNVRKFEESPRRDEVEISLMRGKSGIIMSALEKDSFDFIYIDGDHKYRNAKNDLIQAKRLIKKDFGIICGDDLERLPTSELYEVAQAFPDKDYLRDPHHFHPGILMATHEEFPNNLNMLKGFWWIACVDSEFVKVDLIRQGNQMHFALPNQVDA